MKPRIKKRRGMWQVVFGGGSAYCFYWTDAIRIAEVMR